VQDTLEEKLGAIECESENAEVQWKNIRECVLDTISDLVIRVEKRARKPWITQEMISKMDERRKLNYKCILLQTSFIDRNVTNL